jgi:hypothetical protein
MVIDIFSSEGLPAPVLKIDVEPKKIIVESDLMVVFTKRGYVPALHVREARSKREFILYLSAFSLSKAVEVLRLGNNGMFIGLEFWIRKATDDRMAPYVVEE